MSFNTRSRLQNCGIYLHRNRAVAAENAYSYCKHQAWAIATSLTCVLPWLLCFTSTCFQKPSKPPVLPRTDLDEAVQASFCGNLATAKMATQCSSGTRGNNHGIDIVKRYRIAEQHGSPGEYCSPSNFREDGEDHAKGSNTRDFMPIFREQLREILECVSCSNSTAFEMRLLRDAEKAVAIAKGKAGFNVPENAEQKSHSRRFIMNSLRLAGYNAGVCKSRWDQTNGYPAGDYEFIDVVIEESKLKNERFFVDIDFRAQFEIARPTDDYSALLQDQIPNLFVGMADKLCGIIKIMCNAGRRSLKERGMYIPPWRKYRYMQAKWVGSYKRTTNPGSSAVQGALLQFPFSGIALKATRWDASVVLQMNNDNNATDRYLMKAKSKCTKNGNEQLESREHLLTGGEQDRHVNKISGLATALEQAGLTPLSPSTEPDTIH